MQMNLVLWNIFTKKRCVSSQQDVLRRGLVNRDRKKVSKSKWLHPKNPTPDTFPHLFDNSWSLGELLEEIYKEDLKIIELFSNLGMSRFLADSPMFKARSPQERIGAYTTIINLQDENLLHSVITDIFNDGIPHAYPVPCQEPNQAKATENYQEFNLPTFTMSASKDNTSTIDFKGKSITLSKYVSSVKQRGDIKSSGSRNVKRFMLSDTEEESLRASLFQNLRAGTFIITKGGHLADIIQLKKKSRQFAYMVDEITNSDIYFVCAQYKNFKDNIFYSKPSMIQKRYYLLRKFYQQTVKPACRWKENSSHFHLLRKFYKQTVKPACRWKENSSHFIELQKESEINNSNICDWEDSDKDVTADGRNLSFCRQPASFDDLIQCSDLTCKIKWFHFECVHLTK